MTNQTQTAQIRSTPDVKPVNAAEHTDKLPSASKINHARRENMLEKTQ